MKRICWVLFFCCISIAVFADAGFNITRKQAMSVTSFSGCDNLKSHQLIFMGSNIGSDPEDKRPYASRGTIVNDEYKIETQEGGRHWDESERNIYLVLVDTSNNTITDMLHLYAKDYNMHVVISGDAGGKLHYKIDNSKALYQYMIMGDEGKTAAFKRNRFIFIGASLAGFILLIALFIRKKNNPNA